jgi:hypothetical protein
MLDDELEELLIQNAIDAQVVKIANKFNNAIDTIVDKVSEFNLSELLPEDVNLDQLMQTIKLLK